MTFQGDSVRSGKDAQDDPGRARGGRGGQGGRGGDGGQGGSQGQPGQPGQPGGVGPLVRGSGNVITESRPVAGFDSISFHGAAQLLIDQNGTESLSVEAEDNLLPHLISEVSGRQLNLGVQPGVTLESTRPIIFRLSVRELRKIKASGSGEIEAKNLTGESLEIDQSGSFDMNLQGRATRQAIDLSGSGSLNAGQLDSTEVSVDISGSGDVVVRASSRLAARISGSGTVEYIGDPTITKEISGSGDIRKR